MKHTRTVTIQRMTLFKVITNSDLNKGRGGQVILGTFNNQAAAESCAKGNYVMGTDCPIESFAANVVIDEDGRKYLLGAEVQIFYEDPRKVRDRALAKLTQEERKALGI